MATTAQKIVCASVACAVEIDHGRKFRTVSPPRIPWPMTAARAVQPSTRHPFALLDALRPHRHHDDQQADELGEHAMAVLILHAANHRRDLVQRSERCWPVGNRQPGVIAGHQRAGNDEEKSGPGQDYGEAMMCRIVGDVTRSRRQNGSYNVPSAQSEDSLVGRCLKPCASIQPAGESHVNDV